MHHQPDWLIDNAPAYQADMGHGALPDFQAAYHVRADRDEVPLPPASRTRPPSMPRGIYPRQLSPETNDKYTWQSEGPCQLVYARRHG